MAKSFVTKFEFVSRLSKKVNLTPWKTEKVIDAIMAEIRQVIDEDKSVRFNMIGTFSPGVNAKRNFRNPQNGKIQERPRMFVPKFKISKKWRLLFHKNKSEDTDYARMPESDIV